MIRKRIAKATGASSSELIFPKLVEEGGAQPRIRDNPPLLFHWGGPDSEAHKALTTEALGRYRASLPDDRKQLFDRHELADGAMKVVGIGSVGTFCMVLLFTSIGGDPLFLQVKQANPSVLEPYAGPSAYGHHGQRVVMGPLVETFDAEMLELCGELCGWSLARAHAKAGDPWTISGYLGGSDKFDEAMGDFAHAYADQAEQDHAALKAAVRTGRIAVEMER